jgi:transcriptional regulator with XRE-family HTH domain
MGSYQPTGEGERMNDKDERKEFKRQLGDRMRSAARTGGWTSDRLAEAMDVEGGTVRGWWVGRTEPSVGKLTRYAELVKVSVEWLLHGDERPMGASGLFIEWFLRVRALTDRGLTPAEAIEEVTGPAPTGVEGWELTPEERELLGGPPGEVNALLHPRSPDLLPLLLQLSAEDQQMVRQLIARLASRDAAGDEER